MAEQILSIFEILKRKQDVNFRNFKYIGTGPASLYFKPTVCHDASWLDSFYEINDDPMILCISLIEKSTELVFTKSTFEAANFIYNIYDGTKIKGQCIIKPISKLLTVDTYWNKDE